MKCSETFFNKANGTLSPCPHPAKYRVTVTATVQGPVEKPWDFDVCGVHLRRVNSMPWLGHRIVELATGKPLA